MSKYCDQDLIDPLHLENNAVIHEFKLISSEFYSRKKIQNLIDYLKKIRLHSVSNALQVYVSEFNPSKDDFSFCPRLLGPQVIQIYLHSNELCDMVSFTHFFLICECEF